MLQVTNPQLFRPVATYLPAGGGLRRVVLAWAGGRRRDHGTVGQRQELVVVRPWRARAAHVRARRARWPRPVPVVRECTCGLSQSDDRVCLSGPLPPAAMLRPRKRPDSDARGPGAGYRGGRSVRHHVSPSPARSFADPGCSCATSRPATWTRPRPTRLRACFSTCSGRSRPFWSW